jgi:hypothetical protein
LKKALSWLKTSLIAENKAKNAIMAVFRGSICGLIAEVTKVTASYLVFGGEE